MFNLFLMLPCMMSKGNNQKIKGHFKKWPLKNIFTCNFFIHLPQQVYHV